MNCLSNIPIYSQIDIIDTLKRWRTENAEETFDTVLYFVSELTGLSTDKIMELL